MLQGQEIIEAWFRLIKRSHFVAIAVFVAVTLLPMSLAKNTSAQSDSRFISVERGGFYRLSAVAGLTNSKLWAVGWNALVRFDGASWVLEHKFPSDQEWTRLEAGRTAIYGIGNRCNLLEIREPLHIVHELAQNCHLHDLSITEGGEIWLAGGESSDKKSHVILWTQGNAQKVVVPDVGPLTAIYMNEDQTGWAFGPRGILKRVSDIWELSQPGLMQEYSIRAIDAVSPSNVWAVGGTTWLSESGKYLQLIMHYDGSQWSVWRSSAEAKFRCLNDVVMLSDGTGWAAGDGFRIFYFDGKDWTLKKTHFGGTIGQEYHGVTAFGQDDVWFVGDRNIQSHWDGTFFRDSGGQRALHILGNDGNSGFSSIDVLRNGNGWAAGLGGPPAVRSSSRWYDSPSPIPFADTMISVLVYEENDIWFGSDIIGNDGSVSQIVHGNGETWISEPSGVNLPILQISREENERLWAIASTREAQPQSNQSAILKHDRGLGWSVNAQFGNQFLRSIAWSKTEGVWAGGSRLMHLNGDQWTIVEGVISQNGFVADIDLPGDGRVLVAGGHMIHVRDDKGWRTLDFRTVDSQDFLTGIAGAPDGAVWVTADSGAYVCYEAGCKAIPLPTVYQGYPFGFSDIVVVPEDESYRVWLAGEWGSIISVDSRILTTMGAEPTPILPSTATPTQQLERMYLPFLTSYR